MIKGGYFSEGWSIFCGLTDSVTGQNWKTNSKASIKSKTLMKKIIK
jgi:hypothetical protein